MPPMPGRQCRSPALNIRLHSIKDLARDDGLVIVLNEILRQLALVFLVLLFQMIHAEMLLQQQVADILFIPENLRDTAFHPFAAKLGRNAARIQFLADGQAAIAKAAEGKDQLDRFGLIRDNRDPPVIFVVEGMPALNFSRMRHLQFSDTERLSSWA